MMLSTALPRLLRSIVLGASHFPMIEPSGRVPASVQKVPDDDDDDA